MQVKLWAIQKSISSNIFSLSLVRSHCHRFHALVIRIIQTFALTHTHTFTHSHTHSRMVSMKLIFFEWFGTISTWLANTQPFSHVSQVIHFGRAFRCVRIFIDWKLKHWLKSTGFVRNHIFSGWLPDNVSELGWRLICLVACVFRFRKFD